MLNRFIFILGCLFYAVAANAQNGNLRIIVQNRNNSETVPFAYVHIISSAGNSAQPIYQTDENGIANVIPEKYPCTIEISALGFETVKKDFYTPPPANSFTIYLTKKFSTLNEVVITGLTQAQKQKDALSVYRIITKEQIQAQGAVTLNDVMNTQLNVKVNNTDILGANMGMQGLGGDKVKILVDGLPLNGREGGSISLNQVNLNNVDRIEMIQGPMSVVYGTDALGGVINIITKKQNKPFGVSGGIFYESLGKYNFDALATKRIGQRHQVTLGGARNFFVGWNKISQLDTFHDQEITTSRSYTYKPNEQYIGNFSYTYTAPSGFKAHLASDYLDEKVTNKGNLYMWDPFNGAHAKDEYYYTKRSNNRLSLDGKIGKNGVWQSQNGYMIYNRMRQSYIKDMVTLTQELNPGTGMQDTTKFSDIYLRAGYTNKVGKVSYTVGYDVNLQHAFSLKINSKTKDIQDYAAYTNVVLPLLKDKLKIQGGLRASLNTVYNPPVIPSANILYTPVSKVQIRASYAKGYRAPSLKEMYLRFMDFNHEILGNPNLQAESSEHMQLSASYQAYEEGQNYLQIIATGYYNNVKNGITLAPIHPEIPNSIEYTYSNRAHFVNTIASLQADGQLRNLHYQLGYAYNYTFENPGNFSAFAASEANATLQYSWRKPRINFNVFYKYTAKQPFLRTTIDGEAYYDGEQSAFNICDASVEKKLFENRIQFIVGVKNILDVRSPRVSGGSGGGGGAHGGSSIGSSSFLPRSIFTSLRFNIN